MWRCPLLFVSALAGAVAMAQNSSPQKTSDPPDCRAAASQEAAKPSSGPSSSCPSSKPAATPPAADRFPYPGEAPSVIPDRAEPAVAPDTQAPAASKQFPYPGESTSSTDDSSSSSSSSAKAPDTLGDSDPGAEGGAADRAPAPDTTGSRGSIRRKLPKVERVQSDEDREAEDLSVARFYRQSGNLQAAYLRAKDAVKMQPDDPEAHFLLAEVSRTLVKKEEAATEYSAYLKLDPDGDRVKAAKKALAGLQ